MKTFCCLALSLLLSTPALASTTVEKVHLGAQVDASQTMRSAIVESFPAPAISYTFRCFDKDGKLKWTEVVHNVVTTEGKTQLLNCQFKGTGCVGTWYQGLAGAGTKAAADTAASHAAWSDVTGTVTASANRPAITWGTASGNSLAASGATSYAITAGGTVAGAFLQSVTSGTTGTLYSVSDFGASRTVVSGDTLQVTPTVTD